MHVVRPWHLIIALMLVLIVPQLGHAASQPVTEGWEYRWGDSPFNTDGVPEWAYKDEPGQWHDIGFPSNPPDRNGHEHVWYRVTLPPGEWQDPVLYIYSVDIIVQVYLDNKKIYQYGTFDEEGRGRFEGWPWHEIRLPEGYENKTVYFRVFSDYTDIGLWGEVSIMDHRDLVLYVLENSLESLIIAGFSSLIAILALIFALLQTEKKTFGSIALFTLSSSVMLVSETQASLLISYQPLLWDYLAAGSYYMLPVAMALLLAQWLASHRPWVINLIWKLHAVYLVAAIGLSLVGAVDLSSTFPPFDGLFLISLLTISAVVIRRFWSMSKEQQFLLLAYAVFCALLIGDMAVAHGILPWGRVPVSWGILIFSLTIVIISLWHYVSTQRALRDLNVSLEEQVAERTASAESLARREQARARMLTFENEKSRVLGDMITELQDCVGLKQALGLLGRTMPDLCSPLPGVFYGRSGDGVYERIADWGFGKEPGMLPSILEAGKNLPKPTISPPGPHGPAKEGASDALAGLMCFWINLESASDGTVTEGVLLLEGDGVFAPVENEYGSARLFAALNQAAQRIGIALSSIVLREELQKFSYEDALTGLKNRRYFDQLFEHECAVAHRRELPLSLLVIDIDHFKSFNDTHGHEAGDRALQSVAMVLQRQFRDSDIVCRYGGEEFVVIMPGAITPDAKDRAQHLCKAVSDVPVIFQGEDLGQLTVSVGVACWPDSGSEPEELLGLADKALYLAKEEGRNRVEIYGSRAA
ncbi:GGDEF domain-containing protein [Marinobacter salinus]|uniref:diguanylate cyclase n=1 Tax=Marinobacter salinus TaxID=1874317 RepID=A0A1D9GNB6_9GAMM|nr:GGDEF domain-containing protein [Marinobacter salinus]AOY89132.1 GGDEF domain-containing protein [Marinobacter salinus]